MKNHCDQILWRAPTSFNRTASFCQSHTFHLNNVDALCPSCARFGIVVVIPADFIMVLFYAQRGQNATSVINDQVWYQKAAHPHSTVFTLFRFVY